jgi:hypothetical protein
VGHFYRGGLRKCCRDPLVHLILSTVVVYLTMTIINMGLIGAMVYICVGQYHMVTGSFYLWLPWMGILGGSIIGTHILKVGVTHAVLALYSHCTRTVLALYSHCTRTVLALYSHCTRTVLALYLHCTVLYSHCTRTVLSTVLALYSHCTLYCTRTRTVLALYSHCTLLYSTLLPTVYCTNTHHIS